MILINIKITSIYFKFLNDFESILNPNNIGKGDSIKAVN